MQAVQDMYKRAYFILETNEPLQGNMRSLLQIRLKYANVIKELYHSICM
jgi:hypothetical protein